MFLKLTLENDKKILINVEHITVIKTWREGARLGGMGENQYVKETVEDIERMLTECYIDIKRK